MEFLQIEVPKLQTLKQSFSGRRGQHMNLFWITQEKCSIEVRVEKGIRYDNVQPSIFWTPIGKRSRIDSILNIGQQSQKFKIFHAFPANKLKQTTLNWFISQTLPTQAEYKGMVRCFMLKVLNFPTNSSDRKTCFSRLQQATKACAFLEKMCESTPYR